MAEGCSSADAPPVASDAAAPTALSNELSRQVVGFVYEAQMLLHRGPRAEHPEKPERLTAVLDVLRSSGLLERCTQLPARVATDAELLRVHTADHLASVAAATAAVAEKPTDRSRTEPHGVDAIYYHSETERSARFAAGCVLQATNAALVGECRTAFALVRPPGHHAEADEAMGFCFYNSAAVAAADALARRQVRRVIILDWDVHHGNGTQHIFDEEPRVLFVSLHRFGKKFFPGTGAVDEVGEGAGRGSTLNVPWRQTGLGDADYAAAFALVVMPVLRAFAAGHGTDGDGSDGGEPGQTLLLVSAGFDAALGDLQGRMSVSAEGFAWMMRELQTLHDCRAVVVFEGGYHLQASAACAEAVIRQLMPSPPLASAAESTQPPPSLPSEDDSAAAVAAANADADADTDADTDAGADAVAQERERCRRLDAACVGSLGELTEPTLREIIKVQAPFWPCLCTPEHRKFVDDYFVARSASARRCTKRGRGAPLPTPPPVKRAATAPSRVGGGGGGSGSGGGGDGGAAELRAAPAARRAATGDGVRRDVSDPPPHRQPTPPGAASAADGDGGGAGTSTAAELWSVRQLSAAESTASTAASAATVGSGASDMQSQCASSLCDTADASASSACAPEAMPSHLTINPS